MKAQEVKERRNKRPTGKNRGEEERKISEERKNC
jgi:hypothetical protein